jgi:voltage-gated sodium channel
MMHARKIFLDESIVIGVILVNCISIFIEGYLVNDFPLAFTIANSFFAVFYIIECLVKIYTHSFKGYISKGVNRLDFILSIISIPEILAIVIASLNPDLTFLYSLRAFRLVRGIRLLKVLGIIKNGEILLQGIGRALKSSYLILLLFFLINFILSSLSYNLFSVKAPEYFGSPLESLYSIFKIFTIEGWYEIPEAISERYSEFNGWLVRLYFILILFVGGIFGLSIVNSVFVEGMINNSEMDKKIDRILDRLENIEKTKKSKG